MLMANALVERARSLVPRNAFSVLRRVGTALLTPAMFSVQQGHLRSALAGRAVTSHGEPLPWYTYPAIHFLSGKDLSNYSVLEFGAGQSTLWWAAHARTVVSLEEDPEWYRNVSAQVPPNVSLHLVPVNLTGAEQLLSDQKFDLIIIDGLDRFLCAQLAVRHLVSEGGSVLLDNSDGYWGEEVGRYPILDLFRDRGFQRVDFFGYAPGVIRPHCTSLFFKNRSMLLAGTENVRFLSRSL